MYESELYISKDELDRYKSMLKKAYSSILNVPQNCDDPIELERYERKGLEILLNKNNRIAYRGISGKYAIGALQSLRDTGFLPLSRRRGILSFSISKEVAENFAKLYGGNNYGIIIEAEIPKNYNYLTPARFEQTKGLPWHITIESINLVSEYEIIIVDPIPKEWIKGITAYRFNSQKKEFKSNIFTRRDFNEIINFLTFF